MNTEKKMEELTQEYEGLSGEMTKLDQRLGQVRTRMIEIQGAVQTLNELKESSDGLKESGGSKK